MFFRPGAPLAAVLVLPALFCHAEIAPRNVSIAGESDSLARYLPALIDRVNPSRREPTRGGLAMARIEWRSSSFIDATAADPPLLLDIASAGTSTFDIAGCASLPPTPISIDQSALLASLVGPRR